MEDICKVKYGFYLEERRSASIAVKPNIPAKKFAIFLCEPTGSIFNEKADEDGETKKIAATLKDIPINREKNLVLNLSNLFVELDFSRSYMFFISDTCMSLEYTSSFSISIISSVPVILPQCNRI
jgi:hypothetical protein